MILRYIGGILVAALIGYGVHWHRAEVNDARAAVYAEWGASNVVRNQANDREVERTRAEQQKGIDDANQKIQTALADARAARDSSDQLRKRFAAAARAAAHRAPATPGAASEAAGDPGILLSDVFAVIDERAQQLAQYADAARIAGEACERQYDSLTPP